jgi:hypothetical protein
MKYFNLTKKLDKLNFVCFFETNLNYIRSIKVFVYFYILMKSSLLE